MKLERLAYEPGLVLAFYEEGLSALGALCERSWHDRLEVVAEARAASLWNAPGDLYSGELYFAPSDASAARDAAREIFPGSPLTFRLAEALRPSPLPLERVVLHWGSSTTAPDLLTLEKRWRAQFPETRALSVTTEPKVSWHFSLLALVRLEVQAIDQHWFLHRVAMALPGGQPDDQLARELDFADASPEGTEALPWPALDAGLCTQIISSVLQGEISSALAGIRERQEASLRRELGRIDNYFEHYAAELEARSQRSGSQNVRMRTSERLAAAKAEHARRRADQVSRHEIRIVPHPDALLLVGEPAWSAELRVEHRREAETVRAIYVRRSRIWYPVKP